MLNMISTTLVLTAFSTIFLESVLVSGLSIGDSCTDAPGACDPPLSCVGNPTNKKCFMKKGLGMRCELDPFWVCEEGLMCVDGLCKKRVDAAGACNDPDEACMEPLSCVGNPGKRRCFMKKGFGMRCGKDPFWVCEEGLMCIGGICKKLVDEAGACNDPGETCMDPLSCVGNPGKRRCFMKKGFGMRCGKDPFWVCEEGLVCIEGICKREIGRAGACNDPDEGCASPFHCVGDTGNKKCSKRRFRGMTCDDDPFHVCADHLVCDDGICKKPMSRRGKCEINFQICMPPFSCVGTPELKRCVMKKGEGMVCGKDPFWVCEDGLECVDFRCRVR